LASIYIQHEASFRTVHTITLRFSYLKQNTFLSNPEVTFRQRISLCCGIYTKHA